MYSRSVKFPLSFSSVNEKDREREPAGCYRRILDSYSNWASCAHPPLLIDVCLTLVDSRSLAHECNRAITRDYKCSCNEAIYGTAITSP